MVLTWSTVSEASVVPVDSTTTQDRCMVEHDRTMMGCHTHCPKTMDTRLSRKRGSQKCVQKQEKTVTAKLNAQTLAQCPMRHSDVSSRPKEESAKREADQSAQYGGTEQWQPMVVW